MLLRFFFTTSILCLLSLAAVQHAINLTSIAGSTVIFLTATSAFRSDEDNYHNEKRNYRMPILRRRL